MGIFDKIFGKKKKNDAKIESSSAAQVSQNQTSVDEREKSFDGYRMTVSYVSEPTEKYYSQPTAEMVCEIINQMRNELIEFVIVESSECVGGCALVQCMWGGDGVYQVEAQICSNTAKGVLHRQYRQFTENANEVKDLFKIYLGGSAPDVKDWEYMDDFDFYED